MRNRPPNVYRMREPLEGPINQIERVTVAQVRRAPPVWPLVIEVLRPAEQRVKLHRPRRPAGNVVGEQLQQRQRALAPAITQRIGYLTARDQNLVALAPLRCLHGPGITRFMHRLVADQIADIGRHPVVAGLDKPVVVEACDILLDHVDLLVDHAQQRPQRITPLGITHAMHDGQQFI